jgi:hypothetical protein
MRFPPRRASLLRHIQPRPHVLIDINDVSLAIHTHDITFIILNSSYHLNININITLILILSLAIHTHYITLILILSSSYHLNININITLILILSLAIHTHYITLSIIILMLNDNIC